MNYYRINRARPIPGRALPATVRITTDSFGDPFHSYLQADGQWALCGGRGRCRECLKDEAMESTIKRLGTAMSKAFGRDHMQHLDPDDTIWHDPRHKNNPDRGRNLREHLEVESLAACIECEFRITVPDQALLGNPAVKHVVALIDQLVASRDASPH